MRPAGRTIAVILFPFLAITACDDSDPSGPLADSALLSVYLTDAPGDLERAWVEVVEVSFRMHGQTLVYSPETAALIDVTELVDDTHLLVAEQEVEPGDLTELRLVIGEAVVESTSGEVYVLGDPDLPDGLQATAVLQCPSCQQSGIKVKVAGGTMNVDEGVALLLLDFDVAQTFGHAAGASGRWVT